MLSTIDIYIYIFFLTEDDVKLRLGLRNPVTFNGFIPLYTTYNTIMYVVYTRILQQLVLNQQVTNFTSYGTVS